MILILWHFNEYVKCHKLQTNYFIPQIEPLLS